MAIVLTNRAVYAFRRQPGQTWLEVLNNAPKVHGLHGIKDAESIAIHPSGNYLIITTEMFRSNLEFAPVYRIDLN